MLVFAHHPPNDPLPTANSQLADRREAAMVETRLAGFEAGSGKSAAYVGAHVGIFLTPAPSDEVARRGQKKKGQQGAGKGATCVPFIINCNSRKGPSSTSDNGGFTMLDAARPRAVAER